MIIDKNLNQAMGLTSEILNFDNIHLRLATFGWHVLTINGHNFQEIKKALEVNLEKPKVIIANTIKGYPVSFMRGNNFYHYAQITKRVYKEIKKELTKYA